MSHNVSKAFALTLVATATLTSLTGCTSSRSVEGYCSTMEEHKTSYLAQMQGAADSGDLSGIFQAVGAVGDLKIMWTELADVAPEEIRSDTEAVRDAWSEQEDRASSNDLLGSLMTGLLSSGSMARVNEYVVQNCDGGLTAPADDDANAATPSPEALAATVATGVSLEGLETGARAVLAAGASGQILYTAEGDVPLIPAVEAGQQSSDMVFGVEGYADAPVTSAGVGIITTLENGLTAASEVLTLQTFSEDGQVIADAPIDPAVRARLTAQMPESYNADGAPIFVHGVRVAHGAVIVAMSADSNDSSEPDAAVIASFDGATGELLWVFDVPRAQTDCSYRFGRRLDSEGGVLTAGGLYVFAGIDTVIALDVKTGTQTWSNILTGFCTGHAFAQKAAPAEVYLPIQTTSNGGGGFLVDARTGETVRRGVVSQALDPITGNVALTYVISITGTYISDDGAHPAMEVLDPAGAAVFTLPAEEGIALSSLKVTGAFDGRVWITTASGDDMIVAEDGATDPEAATYVGTAVLASTDEWTLTGGDEKGVLVQHPETKPDLSVLAYANTP